MVTVAPLDLILTPINGEGRSISQWTTTFHLVFVALDPYARQSRWLLPTAARILLTFREADCRIAWLATADADKCRSFLGPWADEVLTFTDPERTVVRDLGLERLPALVHLANDGSLVDAAEGWDPARWREITKRLAKMMAWLPPTVPLTSDPAPFVGALANR
ncbi:MAG: hypothetical protein ABIW46_02265 [Acidimicrobiales bacterium]